MSVDQERKQAIAKLGEIIQDIRVAMLTTVMADGTLHSRPMVTADPEFRGDLWFFTEPRTAKVDEIARNQHVSVVFASPKDHRYVAITGSAEVVDDPGKAEVLWDSDYAAWFPKDVEPAQLRFLKVSIEQGEFWDAGSSRMLPLWDSAKSLLGGSGSARQPEHQTVDWSQPGNSSD